MDGSWQSRWCASVLRGELTTRPFGRVTYQHLPSRYASHTQSRRNSFLQGGGKAQRLSNGCVTLGSARAMNSKFSAAVLVINGHVYTNLWLRSNCASNIGLLTTTWCLDKIRPMPISFDTLGIAMADNEYLAQDTFVQNA